MAALETVSIRAAMTAATPATSADNGALAARRATLSAITSTSVDPARRLVRYTPVDPRSDWADSTATSTIAKRWS